MDKEFNVVCPNPQECMTDYQIEQFILFAIAVAGKTAKTVAKQMDYFLSLQQAPTPFKKVTDMILRGTLLRNLKRVHLGRYDVLKKAYTELVKSKLDLRTCTVEDLEKIHGIGPKTARFFIMYTQPLQAVAILDVHILRFLRAYAGYVGYYKIIPKSTPSGKKYKELEDVFLRICTKLQVLPSHLDTVLWMHYSGNENDNTEYNRLTQSLTASKT